jgi:hypothetical protein
MTNFTFRHVWMDSVSIPYPIGTNALSLTGNGTTGTVTATLTAPITSSYLITGDAISIFGTSPANQGSSTTPICVINTGTTCTGAGNFDFSTPHTDSTGKTITVVDPTHLTWPVTTSIVGTVSADVADYCDPVAGCVIEWMGGGARGFSAATAGWTYDQFSITDSYFSDRGNITFQNIGTLEWNRNWGNRDFGTYPNHANFLYFAGSKVGMGPITVANSVFENMQGTQFWGFLGATGSGSVANLYGYNNLLFCTDDSVGANFPTTSASPPCGASRFTGDNASMPVVNGFIVGNTYYGGPVSGAGAACKIVFSNAGSSVKFQNSICYNPNYASSLSSNYSTADHVVWFGQRATSGFTDPSAVVYCQPTGQSCIGATKATVANGLPGNQYVSPFNCHHVGDNTCREGNSLDFSLWNGVAQSPFNDGPHIMDGQCGAAACPPPFNLDILGNARSTPGARGAYEFGVAPPSPFGGTVTCTGSANCSFDTTAHTIQGSVTAGVATCTHGSVVSSPAPGCRATSSYSAGASETVTFTAVTGQIVTVSGSASANPAVISNIQNDWSVNAEVDLVPTCSVSASTCGNINGNQTCSITTSLSNATSWYLIDPNGTQVGFCGSGGCLTGQAVSITSPLSGLYSLVGVNGGLSCSPVATTPANVSTIQTGAVGR